MKLPYFVSQFFGGQFCGRAAQSLTIISRLNQLQSALVAPCGWTMRTLGLWYERVCLWHFDGSKPLICYMIRARRGVEEPRDEWLMGWVEKRKRQFDWLRAYIEIGCWLNSCCSRWQIRGTLQVEKYDQCIRCFHAFEDITVRNRIGIIHFCCITRNSELKKKCYYPYSKILVNSNTEIFSNKWKNRIIEKNKLYIRTKSNLI